MKKNLKNPSRIGKSPADVLTADQRKAYAAALGRVGGSKRSPAKAKAARKNGKLGGRPRKVLAKGKSRKAG